MFWGPKVAGETLGPANDGKRAGWPAYLSQGAPSAEPRCAPWNALDLSLLGSSATDFGLEQRSNLSHRTHCQSPLSQRIRSDHVRGANGALHAQDFTR